MSGDKKLKVVIIGTGSISGVHADAIKATPGLELTACWNRPEERASGEAFANKWGVRYYSSIDDMLESERPDIAVNDLAYKYHALGVEKAASLGSHLVVEKPMGVSLEACRGIIEIASRHKVRLAVSESSWFNALNLTYQSLRGRFGEVIHLIDTNYRSYFASARGPWAFDPVEGFGGMILNVGVHRVARLRMFAGAEESSVCATVGKRLPDKPVEGDASILIRYKNGASGVIMMCGYHNPGKANANICRIVTDNGIVTPGDRIGFTHSDGTEESFDIDAKFAKPDYVNFYSALAESINKGTPTPCPGESGMRDVAVILAAFKSFEEKREVRLNELLGE